MNHQRKEEILCDITIEVGHSKLKVHKNIIEIYSKYFKEVLAKFPSSILGPTEMPSATEQVIPSHIDSTHSSYSDTKVISEVGPKMTQPSSEIQTKFCGNPAAVPKMTLTFQDNIFKEGDGKVFATLMDFMYTGQIEFSPGTIAEAHDMAWKIKLSGVIEMCEDYITEAYDNYELDLKSALQISRYPYLHEKSQCYVTRNFDSLVKKYPEQASKRYLLEQLDKQKYLKESVRYFFP